MPEFRFSSISAILGRSDLGTMLRLIPAPMASSPQPGGGFPFAVAPPPNASMFISASAGTSRTPSMVTNDQPAGPITPVRRFPESTMGMFHGRAMDDGEPSMRMFKCRTCGAVVMEGKRSEHTSKRLTVEGNIGARADWPRLHSSMPRSPQGTRGCETRLVAKDHRQESPEGRIEEERKRE
jgi:hypothetical protein